MSSRGRLLPLALHRAAENMAIDEAIAEAVALENVAPTLRFYGWSRPTLSLGYFQSIGGAEAWSHQPLDIVRRSTGGGAIMHHHELTYSLALPLSSTGPGARQCVYQGVHRCIIEVLAAFNVLATPYRETAHAATKASQRDAKSESKGLATKAGESFLCFQRRTDEDLICNGYKILGSAQRRVRGGVLQHGSLLLQTSPLATSLPGIKQLTDHILGPAELAAAIALRLSHTMSIDWHAGELTTAEQQASERIRHTRYAAGDWTNRR